MNRPYNLVIAAVMVFGIGGLVYAQKQSAVPVQGDAAGADQALLDIVAAHNTPESCWSLINGNVYDLTSWIPNHPGGEQAILQLCGTDGSAKFNGQHGGSARQETVLAGFRIDPGTSGAATEGSASVSAPDPVSGADDPGHDHEHSHGSGHDHDSDHGSDHD